MSMTWQDLQEGKQMNTETKDESRVIEMPAESFSKSADRALPAIVGEPATPMTMLAMAVRQGMSLDTIKELRALQKDWDADEAKKAYNVAFAKFKAEAVKIIKNKTYTDGPLKGRSYAELFAVVGALTPALSENGLSASWKLTKDEKDWIEVTCTLRHSMGHSDSVSMGGPPDTGGAKSPIQARASSVTLLERYTLKAITGVSEQGDDTDGAGKQAEPEVVPDAAGKIALEMCASADALQVAWRKLTLGQRKTLHNVADACQKAIEDADKGAS